MRQVILVRVSFVDTLRYLIHNVDYYAGGEGGYEERPVLSIMAIAETKFLFDKARKA